MRLVHSRDLCITNDSSRYELQINLFFCCELTVGLSSDLYPVQLHVQCFVIKKDLTFLQLTSCGNSAALQFQNETLKTSIQLPIASLLRFIFTVQADINMPAKNFEHTVSVQ